MDVRNLVFIDEAGVHLGMVRLFGRAFRGQRAVDAVPRHRGTNVSLIGALTLDGLVASMTINGSVDTAVFLSYVNEVLAPQLSAGAIVTALLPGLVSHRIVLVEAEAVSALLWCPYLRGA